MKPITQKSIDAMKKRVEQERVVLSEFKKTTRALRDKYNKALDAEERQASFTAQLAGELKGMELAFNRNKEDA